MRRLTNTLSAAALLLGITAIAPAQTFRLETVAVRPGQNATVRLFVTSPVEVAALNFTVRANSAGINGNVTGVRGTAVADAGAWSYVNNTVTNGNAREYRGVVYANATTGFLAATTEHHVATLTVPVAGGAAPLVDIDLDVVSAFDSTDGITALLGVSDRQGRSIVGGTPITAGSSARPDATDGKVKVDPARTDLNFGGRTTLVSGWEYTQGLPTYVDRVLPSGNLADPNLRLVPSITNNDGVLFRMTQADGQFFGFLQNAATDAAVDFLRPATDSVIIYTWDMTSNATKGIEMAGIRARLNARDFSWASIAEWTEAFDNANTGAVVLPIGGLNQPPTRMAAASYIPSWINNGTSINVGGTPTNIDGIQMAIDFLGFLRGAANVQFAVKNYTAYSVPTSSLTGEVVHYNQDFTGGNTGGFTTAGALLTNPGDPQSATRYSVTTSTANGLSITPVSAYTEPIAGFPGSYFLAYANFTRNFTRAEVPVTSTRLYRVDFTLRTTATDLSKAPSVRLRLTSGEEFGTSGAPQPDFTQGIVLSSSGFDTAQFIPNTAGGRTYTSYFVVPTGANGGVMQATLDVYASTIPGLSDFNADFEANAAIVMEDIQIRSYNLPTP